MSCQQYRCEVAEDTGVAEGPGQAGVWTSRPPPPGPAVIGAPLLCWLISRLSGVVSKC